MATNFIQISEDYLRQIDAEVERLHKLREQVQSVVQSESALDQAKPAAAKRPYTRRTPAPVAEKTATKRPYNRRVPLPPPAKKSAAKKTAAKKTSAKKSSAKKTAGEQSA